MTKDVLRRLSLDRPVTYQIKVPGKIDVSQVDWASEMEIKVESEEGRPISTSLIGEFDQAGLHGLLRRLYSHGLPLISVVWVVGGSIESDNLL
jgi:hypothetical protein